MKKLTILLLIATVLSASAQKIVTNIDATTLAKLKPNQWVRVSKNKAIYNIDFMGGSSCNKPKTPTLKTESNTIIVCGNVPYHNLCKKDDVMYPRIYIEIDTKKHPNYKTMLVQYQQNSIVSYPNMENDLHEWETQAHYQQENKPEYDAEKHKKVITNFANNFKFEGTKLEDFENLLSGTYLSEVHPPLPYASVQEVKNKKIYYWMKNNESFFHIDISYFSDQDKTITKATHYFNK